MSPFAVFTHRIRGFRVLDLAAVVLILAIALGSYAFKTFAGAEDADASGVEARILQEEKRVRLLKAEIARLEAPRRLEDLSTRYLGMSALDVAHQVRPEDLSRIAAESPPPGPGQKVSQ